MLCIDVPNFLEQEGADAVEINGISKWLSLSCSAQSLTIRIRKNSYLYNPFSSEESTISERELFEDSKPAISGTGTTRTRSSMWLFNDSCDSCNGFPTLWKLPSSTSMSFPTHTQTKFIKHHLAGHKLHCKLQKDLHTVCHEMQLARTVLVPGKSHGELQWLDMMSVVINCDLTLSYHICYYTFWQNVFLFGAIENQSLRSGYIFHATFATADSPAFFLWHTFKTCIRWLDFALLRQPGFSTPIATKSTMTDPCEFVTQHGVWDDLDKQQNSQAA